MSDGEYQIACSFVQTIADESTDEQIDEIIAQLKALRLQD